MGWKHYQTVALPPPPKKEKRENFPNSSNLQHLNIFLNLTYPFRKKSLSQNIQKSPKNLHQTAKQWLKR